MFLGLIGRGRGTGLEQGIEFWGSEFMEGRGIGRAVFCQEFLDNLWFRQVVFRVCSEEAEEYYKVEEGCSNGDAEACIAFVFGGNDGGYSQDTHGCKEGRCSEVGDELDIGFSQFQGLEFGGG